MDQQFQFMLRKIFPNLQNFLKKSQQSQPVKQKVVWPTLPDSQEKLDQVFHKNQEKLKKMRQVWIKDKFNLASHFYLMRQLNRQGQYKQSIKVYRSFGLHKLFIRIFQSSQQRKKVFQLYVIARKQHIQQKEFPSFLSIILYSLLIFSLMLPFIQKKIKIIGNDASLFFSIQKQTQVVSPQDLTFDDVVGIQQYKDQLVQIVDFLKNSNKYQNAGAKLPKGILLTGQPGTGKTLLARVLASQAKCKFIQKSGSQFDQLFVGTGSKRVRNLFQFARKNSPIIIFIDEIQSLAGKRYQYSINQTAETVNSFLTQMDGFKATDKIIVIGATNSKESIDPAVLRPGRFDKIIEIPLPNLQSRTKIFDYYLRKVKYNQEGVKAQDLAKQTIGLSAASIKNLVNLAAINAVKNQRKKCELQDFMFASDRVQMGVGAYKLFVTDKVKLMTAYHQLGHAICGLVNNINVNKVTILPRGPSLGHTAFLIQEQMINKITKKELQSYIVMCMGGRAAEQVFFGNDEITSGCSSDLAQATKAAYQYVKKYGMEGQLINFSNLSDRYKQQIDKKMQSLLDKCYSKAKQIITAKRDKIGFIAGQLISVQTMTGSQLIELM